MANRIQLQESLHKKYNRSIFAKEILSPVFNSGFSLFAQPVDVSEKPNQTESRVIQQVQVYAKITLDDYTEVNCYEILLQPNVKLERSRVAIQHYVRKLLISGQAALINFVSPSYPNTWRLTFVAKDSVFTEKGVKEKTTHSKRFTFLLGPSETCRTAAERFESISEEKNNSLDLLIKAFSVERLSKIFFDEYKRHYQAFIDYIAESNANKSVFSNDDKAVRDFVKKLMGRIVFLYFVQKKGWLGASNTDYSDGDPHFLMNLFINSGGDETFYENWLKVLFFNTLNSKRDNDDFTLPKNKGKVKIPYLNGGLFDPEDHDKAVMVLAPELFHNEDNADDPKERGFLDFLNSFNFTVFEDSPEEHTVAVDPEMLGHIFENLLEDNKDKGAFYTPKEIVHYMCQESLIEYLTTHLSKEYKVYRKIGDNQIELFGNENKVGQLSLLEEIGDDNALDRDGVEYIVKEKDISQLTNEQLKRIDELLETVKICDPAIGSGAFPMGLLLEIYSIKEAIAFLLNKEWNPAKVKANIIQKSIYGVDIEKGAVDIARLRFWLSLVVDEELPKPLPNLDYKIVVGDSLIGKINDEIVNIDWEVKSNTQTEFFGNETLLNREKLLKQISEKQKEYFSSDVSHKKGIATEIRDLKIDIAINQLDLMYKSKGLDEEPKQGNFKTKKSFVTAQEVYMQSQKWMSIKKELAKLKNDKDKPFKHFNWKLDFPDVLNSYIKGKDTGFDIVIGNPPYKVLSSFSDQEFNFLKQQFPSAYGRLNTFALFTEKALSLYNKDGVCSLIIPDSLCNIDYYQKLRNLLLENVRISEIVELGDEIFDEATVPTIIISFNAQSKKNNKIKVATKNQDFLTPDRSMILQDDYMLTPKNSFNLYADEIFAIVNSSIKSGVSKLLKDIATIKIGVCTGGNSKHISDNSVYPNSKKVLQGKNINRYQLNYDNLYLNYDKKELLRARDEQIFLRTPKLLMRQTSDSLILTYDNQKFYCIDSLFIIYSDVVDIKYLMALLNSKLLNRHYQTLNPEKGRVFAQVKIDYVNEVPIKTPTDIELKKFVSIVDYMLYLNNIDNKQIVQHTDNKRLSSHITDILDMMVYELYFEEHMKEQGIDVLQFIDPKPINDLKTDEEKAQVIKDFYLWYQQPENPVRQRMLLVETRSPDILALINKSVQ